jgi:hypothetical protein
MQEARFQSKRRITTADIMPMAEYEKVRAERRARAVAEKRNRRIAVGPFATLIFENYDTIWYQIHEMLRIEKGGEAQIADELSAYGPLIPNGRELVVTLMFEIDDPARRARELANLAGIEETIAIEVGGEAVTARPEHDVERTREDGKTSAVHFLHFPFTPAAIEKFRAAGAKVVLAIHHPAYSHMTVLPEATRQDLARDFD